MQRKKKRTYRSSATQGCTICAYACKNLEHLFELVVVALNKILLPFSKQCVLFLIRFFFLFYLTLLPRLYTQFFCFFSHASCCSNTHLRIYTHEEITLNGPWTVMLVKGTRYNRRNKSKAKKEGEQERCFIYINILFSNRCKNRIKKPVVNKKRN